MGDAAHHPRSSDSHVQVKLLANVTALQPRAPFFIGVRFTIEPGWHIYWNGMNDTGQAPNITLDLPEGFKQLPTTWPAPKRHVGRGDILDHIYEDSVTLVIPVQTSSTIEPGTELTIKMNADWLVCSDVCVPEEGSAEVTLPVEKSEDPVKLSADTDWFNPVKSSLPATWSDHPKQGSLEWKDRVLTISSVSGKHIEFYPGTKSTPVINPVKNAASDDGKLVLRFDADGDEPVRAHGIVAIWPDSGSKAKYYDLDVKSPAPREGKPGSAGRSGRQGP